MDPNNKGRLYIQCEMGSRIPTDLTSFQSLSRTALNGKVLAIVKTNAKDKKIHVTAKTKKMESCKSWS
ncbi:hypothetical protein [Sphingobacterium pedocola]|uniref:Glycoside hydrolase family 2 domain-containing protein n=1 Tax=Sphingobacterium pedocola TaxID=2082722 RepID=A0ABR9T1T4_9SPHI|nr:hypothetical protein [Sphingobacterium pedocola]